MKKPINSLDDLKAAAAESATETPEMENDSQAADDFEALSAAKAIASDPKRLEAAMAYGAKASGAAPAEAPQMGMQAEMGA